MINNFTLVFLFQDTENVRYSERTVRTPERNSPQNSRKQWQERGEERGGFFNKQKSVWND